jgi:hypothetical protein
MRCWLRTRLLSSCGRQAETPASSSAMGGFAAPPIRGRSGAELTETDADTGRDLVLGAWAYLSARG